MRKRVTQLFLVLSSLLLFVHTTEADAAEKNIKEWIKTEVSSDDVYAPAKFSVVPQFVSGQTVIRTFGKDFEVTTQNSNGNYAGLTIRNPLNSDKGKFGVYYDHIASHQGRDLTLKVTVMDWSGYNTVGYQVLSFGRAAIGFTQTGFNWVDLKWEYQYTDTGEKATDIDGSYMNVIDIDVVQGVEFDKDTTSKIEKIYVTNDTWINYTDDDGKLHLFESDGLASNNDDEFAMFTVLFNEGHTFRFRWTKDYASRGTRPNTIYGDDLGGNEFFGFNGQKLVRTEVLEPFKFIRSGNDLLSESVLACIEDALIYEVYHTVPDEISRFYYQTYAMIDSVPSGLSIEKVEIFNHAGADVSDRFSISVKNSIVEVNAKSTALANRSFYNTTYRTVITTKIDDLDALEKTLKENANEAVLENTATLIIDSKSNTTDKVVTKLYRRKIIVDHVDEKTNELLKNVTEFKFDGEKYRYKPFEDLENRTGDRFKSKVVHEGTVSGKDLQFEIPHYIPSLKIDVDSIQIDTGKAAVGGTLLTKLTFSKEVEYEDELDKVRFSLSIADQSTNQVVYEQEMSLDDFREEVELAIPADDLLKNQKIEYLINIDLVDNPDGNKFQTDTKDLKTHGFTSSEKVLTNADLNDGAISYTAVARTLRLRLESEVQEFNETLSFEYDPSLRSKTGYGFVIEIDPLFSSQIHDVANGLNVYVDSPNELMDSYIQEVYVERSGIVSISLENTDVFSRSGDSRTDTLLKYQFPEIRVERLTGNLYTVNQVATNHTEINHDLLDGGRKFYLPIWLDLGEYVLSLRSDEVGKNLICFDMKKEIDVFAYMYATMDSETKTLDELLLTPVFAETEAPDGWSDADVAWLRGE